MSEALDLSPRARLERQFELVAKIRRLGIEEERDAFAALGLVAWNLKHWIMREDFSFDLTRTEEERRA